MLTKLELHNELIARIFSVLLKGGVARVDFCSNDEALRVEGLEADPARDFIEVLVWLQNEGFVRHKSFHGGEGGEACVTMCCLTGMALAALNQQVSALGMTAAEVVRESEKPGSPASTYVRAGSLIGGMMGGFTKAIS
jgi:hypothetical protein